MSNWSGKKHKKSSILKMRKAKLGRIGYWRGKTRPTGEESCNWKGEDILYGSMHDWVRSWKGVPTTCEGCGKTGFKRSQIHWANKDHKYRKILDDYIRLCAKCHWSYDIINGLRKTNAKS